MRLGMNGPGRPMGAQCGRLKFETTTDVLTGASPPRAYDQCFAAPCIRRIRASSPLGFLMIDANPLKHCHDRHGRLGRNRVQVSER